jgi:TrmH family RNA methyltransferase
MAGENIPGQHPLAVAPTLTEIARLQCDRRYRDAHDRFFVEGVRNFVTAVDYGCTVDALLYSERLLTSPIARKLVPHGLARRASLWRWRDLAPARPSSSARRTR